MCTGGKKKKRLEGTFPRPRKAAKTWKTSQSRNISKAKVEELTLANWRKEEQSVLCAQGLAASL